MRGPKPKVNRLGETNIMKNGMMATIIHYRSSADIDVQFSDGVIITNKPYDSFRKGLIGHPNTLHKSKIKNRIGETNHMSNGMIAEIINYISSTNIDVQFEDGCVRKGCAYKEFVSGNIAHPSHTSQSMSDKRLGEFQYMNCGLKAQIINYRKYHDIDILFEDGEIIEHVDYGRFKEGSVEHPMLKDRSMSLQESAITFYLREIGFSKTHRGQLKELGLEGMELDFYHKDKQIAIEVDGGVHKNEYQLNRDMRKNRLCYENGITLYRLRDKSLPELKDGLSINFILTQNPLLSGLVDCTEELKTILKQNNLELPFENFIDFKRDLNQIMDFHNKEYINYYKKKRVGESEFHKPSNQMMTIIDYRDYNHIDIQFDDGTIVYNKNYGSFKKREIQHPSQSSIAQKEERLGEKRAMNCGSIAQIQSYRTAEDLDIEFEDGTMVYNVTYYNFSKGNIRNPAALHTQTLTNRIGETGIMNCGKQATIIAYRNHHDIDIQFEDGTEVQHKKYDRFKKGEIGYPNNHKQARIGQINIMNNGMSCKIIEYRSSKDITVQFADGYIVQHTRYQLFQNGNIANPNIRSRNN